jgi:N-acetylcysteine deacetylase
MQSMKSHRAIHSFAARPWLVCLAASVIACGSQASGAELVRETYVFLHSNPEIGKKEVEASQYISRRLKEFGGFRFEKVEKLPTAIVAVFDTGRAGQTRAFRAELDGRKLDPDVTEPATHSPRSTLDGFMHNCGHDAHAAMLIGAAEHLALNPNQFAGRLVFVFQPAEESAGGADDIVNNGVLARLGVTSIYAQHVAPGMPVGEISLSRGTPLAGSWTYELKLNGKASHAAVPFEGTDTAVVAAKLALELAAFPAHSSDIANEPAVISVSKIIADSPSVNALPESATITGTIRAFHDINVSSDPRQDPIIERLRNRLMTVGDAHGIKTELNVKSGAPPTHNDDMLFDKAVQALRSSWGARLTTPIYRGMFAEDFAFYTRSIPSLYFGLGIHKENLGDVGVHSPDFTLHPDALEQGVRLLIDLMKISQEP